MPTAVPSYSSSRFESGLRKDPLHPSSIVSYGAMVSHSTLKSPFWRISPRELLCSKMISLGPKVRESGTDQGRYYAIACAMLLSVLNWVLVGVYSDILDLFYLESWQVFLTCKSLLQ